MFLIVLLLAVSCFTQVMAETNDPSRYVRDLNPERLNGSEPLDLDNIVPGSGFGSSRVGPLQMGITIYDYQHNGSMGRQVTYDSNNDIVHFTWMWRTFTSGVRAMKYNAYLSSNWDHGSGETGGLSVSGANGGYGGIDLASNGRALIYHHEGVSGDYYRSHAVIDILPPSGAFTFYGAPSPSADGVINCEGWETGNYEETSKYIWPKAEFDICDSTDIVHMVATESVPSDSKSRSGGPGPGSKPKIRTIVYYRGTAHPTTGTIT